MTLEVVNVFINAGILALLIGGGIWIKHIVDQQLKNKDTAIGALEAVVKVKEAQIVVLQSDTAPEIVEAYAKMRAHANQATKDNQELIAKYEGALASREAFDKLVPAQEAVSEAKGIMVGGSILNDIMGALLFPQGEMNVVLGTNDNMFSVIEAYLETNRRLTSESVKRTTGAGELLKSIVQSEKSRSTKS
jgi:hypothetical protein